MNNPLLIFPKPSEPLPRTYLKPPPRPKLFGPSKDVQKGRFESKISSLDIASANETINLSQSIIGLEPERVLVFELKGELVDFYKAVEKTEGMEFLCETYICEEEPDENFVFKKDDIIEDAVKIPKRLFLTINNLTALNQIKSYWDNYIHGTVFRRGTTKFRTLFEQLNDIRYYSVKDRYEDTGILEYFHERLELGEEELFFEIELTFRDNVEYLNKVYNHIKALVEGNGGYLIESSYTIIKEIKYHAVIAKVPINLFEELKDDTNISFFKCEQVLYFRPIGQTVFNHQIEENISDDINRIYDLTKDDVLKEDSVVALLDGLPLQNHLLLQNKLIIDDPENIERNYPSGARIHGTSMASLILYGDLNSEQIDLLSSKILIIPILFPVYNNFYKSYDETIPNNKLFIDLIHTAVKRIFEGVGGEDPVAPNTKIINLSIGDVHRPFIYNNSSWSRLIDWLSYKYNVLFIISCGNFTEDIEIELNSSSFESLPPSQKESLLLASIIKSNYNRKIIAPAESINAITVGAFNSDEYNGNYTTNSYRVELLENNTQISPISRIGKGYLNSIKPEILMQGGRQLYRPNPSNPNLFGIDKSCAPPGHKVAFPDYNNTNRGLNYTRGTSNSAALATRFGCRIHEVLEELSFESLVIPKEFYSVIIKSLLVHGASNENMDLFYNVLGERKKTKLLSYIGNGIILNENKVLSCTEQQVTLIGYGNLNKDESHLYELPLPNEISTLHISKQLTITLSWFSPLNFTSNKYRKAALYIDNISGKNAMDEHIDWDGSLYDFNASKKGTVQHLRYQGTGADAYIEDSTLKIKINCREDAVKLSESIKYGLAVTFELLDNTTINIYNEIRQRIAQQIRIS